MKSKYKALAIGWFVAAIVLMPLSSKAGDEVTDDNTAVDLINNCRAANTLYENKEAPATYGQGLDGTKCYRYIQGFLDGVNLATVAVAKLDRQVLFCPQDNVSLYQYSKVLVTFADQNPVVMNQMPAIVLMAAFGKSFPCSKK